MKDDFDSKFQDLIAKFKTLNHDEIYEFIAENDLFLDLYDDIVPLIEKYFPKCSCSLEFHADPEFDNLNQLVIYVHSNDEDFEKDWKKLEELNEDIRESLGSEVKELISVDLW